MIKTIKFLHPEREVAETISKPQLMKETVFSIERLLPENCRYCNEVYATKHGIQPPLQCYHCKQGIHENCSKLVDIPEIPQIPGLIWLCGYCQPRVTFTASSTVYTGKATTSLGKTKSTPSVMSSGKNPNTTAEDKVILKEDEPPSDKSGLKNQTIPNAVMKNKSVSSLSMENVNMAFLGKGAQITTPEFVENCINLVRKVKRAVTKAQTANSSILTCVRIQSENDSA